MDFDNIGGQFQPRTTDSVPGAIDKGIWSGETALPGFDGSDLPASPMIMSHIDSNGRLLYLSTIIRDISETKCAQQERVALETCLRQARKMESIGILAGGIAHDINNLPGAILLSSLH